MFASTNTLYYYVRIPHRAHNVIHHTLWHLYGVSFVSVNNLYDIAVFAHRIRVA